MPKSPQMDPLEAYNELMLFASERGEVVLRLALHAAVPQSFRPDLLHLLCLNFVPEAVHDPEAEADVLLAPFCKESSGYFQFDSEVRRQLLENLDPSYPDEKVPRLQRIAAFLVRYCEQQSRGLEGSRNRLLRDYLEIQRWVALAFLDSEAAAVQLAAALEQAAFSGEPAARLRVGGLTSALSLPLIAYPRLLTYAAGLEALERGQRQQAKELLERVADEEIKIGNLTLRSPRKVLDRLVSGEAPIVSAEIRESRTTPEVATAPHEEAIQPSEEAASVKEIGKAFVPNYEHDVFISYAPVDDVALTGVRQGWVTTLVMGLRHFLREELGRADNHSVWMDYRLAGNDPVTPAILDALRQSATLVIILSPGYLASQWCRREWNIFLQMTAQRVRAGSRVFVVERDQVDVNDRPMELLDLLGYRFWVQDRENGPTRTLGDPGPPDRAYHDQLLKLVNDLTKELQRLKLLAGNTAAPTADSRPTVYLAEVTDDLEVQRDEVSRYLDQAGFRVVPAETSLYSRYLAGTEDIKPALAKELEGCQAFVQLLSGLTGKRPGGRPSFPSLQYEAARDTGKPILQWCSPELSLDWVDDPSQRALLGSATVYAVGLEEFKRAVVASAAAQSTTKLKSVTPNLVLLSASAEDYSLAHDIGKFLEANGIGYALPLRAGDPAAIRQELEDWLTECDGLILVYGAVHRSWARAQLLHSYRSLGKRNRPLRVLAVYEGPPEEKENLGVELPGMMVINCRKGLNVSELRPFLEKLQAGGNP